jgi:hypothetical protein
MSLDQETVKLTKAVLRSTDSDIRKMREELLDPSLGDSSEWLAEGDDQLEEALDELLDDDEADELATLVKDTSASGIRSLVAWFEKLLGDAEDDEEFEFSEDEPAIVSIEAMDDYPEWWAGLDTATEKWKYINSTSEPTGDEPGWLDQDTAFAAMSADDSADEVIKDISQVDDYPNWWAGLDTTDDEWKYINSTSEPTSATTGWLDQKTAFAAMRAEATPVAKDDRYELEAYELDLVEIA